MLGIIIETGVRFGLYWVFVQELKKACDKIIGTDESYEEWLERKANEEAEKIRRRNRELV